MCDFDKRSNAMSETYWSKYPRPQMKRESFCSLNGVWQLNGSDIIIPYPPQSKLSEYKGEIGDTLIYERTFTVPADFTKERILLHFGAIDQKASVWVNNKMVGSHEGGYLPFYFDITDAVRKNDENTLRVEATDTLDTDYPYGKQTKKPGGMWYKPVSGIWQTVWLENVPQNYIENVKLDVSLDSVKIRVNVAGNIEENVGFKAVLPSESANKKAGQNVCGADGGEVCEFKVYEFSDYEGEIVISNPIHWTPDNPHLYNLIIETGEDRVETYFALRTIDIQEIDGVKRVCLNGKPIFMHGVLDQGYFADGIYTPQSEKEYDRDILRMKELGFNMLRKHIKVEPEYFYYACDKFGMLVMQDMVNTGKYSFIKDTALPTIGFKKKSDEVKKLTGAMINFKEHMKETIEKLYNHPCIVAYTIFNEGWGQFNSDEMYDYAKMLDNTRLIDSTSGWFAQKKNDFDSQHIYFKTIELKPKDRPMFVTECGGYKLMNKEHFAGTKEYGYGTCKDEADLTGRIEEMYEKMIIPGIEKGVCGCIYTQLSDVEDEINGLYTYDREVCKVDVEAMRAVADKIAEKINA